MNLVLDFFRKSFLHHLLFDHLLCLDAAIKVEADTICSFNDGAQKLMFSFFKNYITFFKFILLESFDIIGVMLSNF